MKSYDREAISWKSSKFVRIRPPSRGIHEDWTVIHLRRKISFQVDHDIAKFLCDAFSNSRSLDQHSRFHPFLHEDDAGSVLNELIENGFIISSNDEEPIDDGGVYDLMIASNWTNDADYWISTFETKFMDFSAGGTGYRIQGERMHAFASEREDTERCKTYPSPVSTNRLPKLERIESRFQAPSMTLLEAISIANCKIGQRIPEWKGAPLLRRSSPSGGSRHPIETYFFNIALGELPQGLHHIQIDPPSVSTLQEQNDPSIESICKQNGFIGIFVFSAVFSRNMYRYREPRTLRSVLIDSGHILETNSMVLGALGFKTKPTFSGMKQFEEIIGLDGLSESAIAALGVYK